MKMDKPSHRSYGGAAICLVAALLLAGCDGANVKSSAAAERASSPPQGRDEADDTRPQIVAVEADRSKSQGNSAPLSNSPKSSDMRRVPVESSTDIPSMRELIAGDIYLEADRRDIIALNIGKSSMARTRIGTIGAPYDELAPVIPWPPPIASARADVTAAFLGEDRGYASIDRRLRGLLSGKGYSDLYYFSTPPGGFVIMTRAERIDDQGVPQIKDRWLSTKQTASLSAGDYLHKLIFGDDGRIRILTFVVSARDFRPEGGPATDADVQRWRSSGQPKLSASIAAAAAPPGSSVTLLIYEFQLDRREARQLEASSNALPAAAHMTSLGLKR